VTSGSLFPDPDELGPKLRALADEAICFGTSSWKYEGWFGSIYSEDRYVTRGKHSKSKTRTIVPGGVRSDLPDGAW
jgi:hypothetical protein